jgi:hypothetical protein
MRTDADSASSYGVDWRDRVNPLLSGWTADRVANATSFIRARVAADVRTSGLAVEGELLAFRTEDGEVLATAFRGEHDFPIELHEGPESACALTADQIQDGVVDRLHRPWPELVDADGGFVGVLDVATAAGIACWVLRGVPFCAIGQLAGAVPAAGLRLGQGAAR